MSLGERIQLQRKRRGFSQEKLADLVGVSRQAVTKWEAGQSAPSTENLFRLAQVLGTTVDLLLTQEDAHAPPPAESSRFRLHKKNALTALLIALGYLLIYLLCRIFSDMNGQESSLTGWLFGLDLLHLPYLYGWLLSSRLFWVSMAISVLPALFGKSRFSMVTLGAFALGLLLGHWLGPVSAPAGYDYGWLIWGGIFLLSIPMGILLERLWRRGLTLRAKALWVWCAVFLAGIAAILLLVLTGIPPVLRH